MRSFLFLHLISYRFGFHFSAVCDFFGEKMASLLGLNAAKYQYAIDQHHRHHQVSTSSYSTLKTKENRFLYYMFTSFIQLNFCFVDFSCTE